MRRESHLFACHKYLEQAGSLILMQLAKADFRDSKEIRIICKQLEDYLATLHNHARWEEDFIFAKFFTKEEIAAFFSDHTHLEQKGKDIVETLKKLLDLGPLERVYQGNRVYLDFRHFYALNLAHFNTEETDLLGLLQNRATDDEIRAIDKQIYQSMSSLEIVGMLESLLPPTNISEKKKILEDIKQFNPANFATAIKGIRKILSTKEALETFGEKHSP